jgi:integrase
MLAPAWLCGSTGPRSGAARAVPHLADTTGYLVIDPDIGALLESSRDLELGPPKTAEYARTITLPPFPTHLLRAHLQTHNRRHVFPAPDGGFYRRSNFSRRVMRPAAGGTPRHRDPGLRLPAVHPGLTFHGLRHSHKTWMIADNVPEIAQAQRLGHTLQNKIQQTYSHVAAEVDTRLLDGLQDRWGKAVADRGEALAWPAA